MNLPNQPQTALLLAATIVIIAFNPGLAMGRAGASLVSQTSKLCLSVLQDVHDSNTEISLTKRRRVSEQWASWIPVLETFSTEPAKDLAQLLLNEKQSGTTLALLYPKREDFRFQRACESLLGFPQDSVSNQELIAGLVRVLTPYYTIASPAQALESSRLEVSDGIQSWRNTCSKSDQRNAVTTQELNQLNLALRTLHTRALTSEEPKNPNLISAARNCGRYVSNLVTRPSLACDFLTHPRLESCLDPTLRFP